VARGGTAGQGSRAPRGKPARAAQLPYLVVLAIAAGGLAWMWQGGIQRAKEGTLALAGAMFIGALARTVLPEARAGMLASRRRLVDVVSLAALGIGLLVVALVLPTPP
jgi:peptidoglycan/LPS O-acetylase OafA/YrhL